MFSEAARDFLVAVNAVKLELYERAIDESLDADERARAEYAEARVYSLQQKLLGILDRRGIETA